MREKGYHAGRGRECEGEYNKVEEDDLEDKRSHGDDIPKNVVADVKRAVQGEGGDNRSR